MNKVMMMTNSYVMLYLLFKCVRTTSSNSEARVIALEDILVQRNTFTHTDDLEVQLKLKTFESSIALAVNIENWTKWPLKLRAVNVKCGELLERGFVDEESDRSALIQIGNDSVVKNNLNDEIEPGLSQTILFQKKSTDLRGICGTLTYEIANTNRSVIDTFKEWKSEERQDNYFTVMFTIPYNLIFSDAYFATAIWLGPKYFLNADHHTRTKVNVTGENNTALRNNFTNEMESGEEMTTHASKSEDVESAVIEKINRELYNTMFYYEDDTHYLDSTRSYFRYDFNLDLAQIDDTVLKFVRAMAGDDISVINNFVEVDSTMTPNTYKPVLNVQVRPTQQNHYFYVVSSNFTGSASGGGGSSMKTAHVIPHLPMISNSIVIMIVWLNFMAHFKNA